MDVAFASLSCVSHEMVNGLVIVVSVTFKSSSPAMLTYNYNYCTITMAFGDVGGGKVGHKLRVVQSESNSASIAL